MSKHHELCTGSRGGDRMKEDRTNIRRTLHEEDLDADGEIMDQATRLSAGANRKYGYKSKSSSFHYAYFKKFLKANAGRKWDEVYSEISKEFRSPHDRHLFMSMFMHYVDLHVEMVDGIPYAKGHEWRITSPYVHPETGILESGEKEAKAEKVEAKERIKARKAEIDARAKWINTTELLLFHNKVWWHVTVKPLPANHNRWESWLSDAFLGMISWYEATQMYGKAVYATSKRQANRREIKRVLKEAENES